VDEERSRWFEIEQQVFTASPRQEKPATGRERLDPFDVEGTPHGDRLTANGHDSAPRHLEGERTAYGLDFGKLGHRLSRGLETGAAQTIERGHDLVRAWGSKIAVRPPAEQLPVTVAQAVEHLQNCGQRLALGLVAV
jgi:hypothetical protein